MFTLKFRLHDVLGLATADNEEEILSVAISAFNQGAQLVAIYEDETLKYEHVEIYSLIKRVYY